MTGNLQFPPVSPREELVNKLVVAISRSGDIRGTVVLTGQPGSGKTQLAAAACGRLGNRFQSIHWIEASEPLDIPVQIAALGKAAFIRAEQDSSALPSAWPEKLPDQVEATLATWNQSPDRLVVFNHFNDPSLFNEWANKLNKVSILITTSSQAWPAENALLHLGEAKREDSIAILCSLSPRFEKVPAEKLGPLAGRLGDLPLALNLAGRYLNERQKMAVGDYLSEIEKTISSFDTQTEEWVGRSQPAVSAELAAVIALSVRLLDSKGDRERLAQKIFFRIATCASHLPVSINLLSVLINAGQEKQPLLDRSLDWLYSLGLLDQTNQGPLIHPILAEYAGLKNQGPESALVPVTEAIVSQANDRRFTNLPLEIIQPHLRAIAARSEGAGLPLAGEMWSQLGTILHNAGENNDAKACLERSLEIEQRLYGTESVKTAQTLLKLGKIFADFGDLHAARDYLQNSLAITEKVFSPVYPGVATILNELGQVIFDLDDLTGAKGCFERALSIHEKAYGYGPKHPAIVVEAGNLGRVLRDLNDLKGARKSFERALSVAEWVYGPKHPTIITYANYLGRICYNLGEFEAARNYYERVSFLIEAVHGANHTSLAVAFNNLGMVLQDLGDLARARDCFIRSLQIDELVYGKEHPNVARDSNNLGSAHLALGDLPAARDCFRRALDVDMKIFGEVHPNNSTNANNLGRVLYNLGDLNGARKTFEQTLAIDEQLYGLTNYRVGTDVNNLGTVLYEMGDLQEAKKCFARALGIFQKELAPDHPKTIKAQRYLDKIEGALS